MTATHPELANPYTLWVAAHDLLGSGNCPRQPGRIAEPCPGRPEKRSAWNRPRKAAARGC